MILSIDIGTSSSRASLYDEKTGSAIPGAFHAIPHEPEVTPEGGSILDPESLVKEAVVCARAMLAHPAVGPISGVGISAFWHSIIGVDSDGNATTPVLLWSDTRSAPQVAALRAEMDAATYSQRTGCPLHTSYPPGKLRWLAETNRAVFDASARFVSPGEFLIGKLFGWDKVTCSISMASGTGMLDQARGAWDDETLRHLPKGLSDRLSRISNDPVSGLLSAYRDSLEGLHDVPWFPALGDGACSNIGCGALNPGVVALMIGTSGALRVAVPGAQPPVLPTGLWRYQIDSGRFLLGGALSNGGNVWSWAKRTFKLPETDRVIDTALAALAPDSHGLTVLPFLSGDRAPLWRDDLRATIDGLTAATTPEEIVRAHLEAVAFRFAAVRDALLPVAPKGELLGTGGALIASPMWTRILADALEEPVKVSSEEQASSRGAALWAREKLGLGRMEDAHPEPITETFQPDPANVAIYRKARARQEALLTRLMRS